TSTSDGEYVECTSLIPYSTNSFKRSKHNDLAFCLGNLMNPMGYSSHAYHAHTATYYGRNETHPNMGYEFKAKKAGLQITDQWPESDLEMMQNSIPDYINEEHFNVYYMTVSGHLEYNFSGNMMSAKNKELVKDLPYSDAVKAYISCNIELDRALEYLIDQLEKAGIADKTVIAFGADHYPYGLTNEQINERAGYEVETNFELYRNNFVLWSESIEEPIVIDKYASSLDMLPTLLNLLGIDYDSRLLMGRDILSDSPALVIFSNQSFITDFCKYNSKTGEVTMLKDVELPEGYIDAVTKIVRNKFDVSKSILLNDYYRYLPIMEKRGFKSEP
ncbi:MAG: LTA synthase family protein, partial [Lachnospiraceae bacterium]|nr:LTA synthase family protein [Lachnospiraceae bacterium]